MKIRKKNARQITALYLFVLLFTGCASIQKEPGSGSEAAPEPALPVTKISEQSKHVSIVAVGDIMLGGKGRSRFETDGYDFPFVATRELLQSGDIVIGNLETALTDSGARFADKKYTFRNSPDKVAKALKQAGFDIVSLANNHSMDYGEAGLRDTLAALDRVEVHHHGVGLNLAEARKPRIFTLENGQTVAFLAYSNTFPQEFWATANAAGTAFGHEAYVRQDIADLVEQKIDIIVVSFHWGQERTTELRSYQPLLAHAAIDAGADLVIGHHPHILQAVEQYKSGLILYSLGNYTFSTFSPHVHTSVVANVDFIDGKVVNLEMTPININNFQVELTPQILTDEKAENVYKEIQNMSAKHNTFLQFRDNKIIFNNLTK